MTNPIIIVISPENKTLEEIRARFPLFDVRHALGADDISALTLVVRQVAAIVIHLKTQDEWVNFDFLRTCFEGTPIFAIIHADHAESAEYAALKRAAEYGAEMTCSEPVNFEMLAQAIRKAATKTAALPNTQNEVRGLTTEHLELSIKINQQISRLHNETSNVILAVSESFRNPDARSISELRDLLRHIETVSFESY